jgi:hypothetical protein
MLPVSPPKTSNKMNDEQGFVILTSSILLSIASIMFTTNMASSQMVDNQIIGNYYRNNEAFSNAESGINFVFAQLDDTVMAAAMLADLPFQYVSTTHHYNIRVEEIYANKVKIVSVGTSIDGTARREINVEVDYFLNYPIPLAALSANGKLNLDDSALVNDGCEGLAMDSCIGSGNVAEQMLVSNPDIEDDVYDELCAGGQVGINIVADGVLKGESELKKIDKITAEDGSDRYDWEKVTILPGSKMGGLSSDENMLASSLFEATFGIEMNQANLDNLWDNTASIDMAFGGECAEMLNNVRSEDEIIFIRGDCEISQYYATQSKTSENKVFTIGSTKFPKLIFIQGGTFITAPNTGIAVVGMLYFLPGKHDRVNEQGNILYGEDGIAIQVEDSSIDMGGINVNGALLSEYKCSHDGYDKTDKNGTKQHFSVRFDKQVLSELYSQMGMGAIGSYYRFSSGTWRDF